MNEAIVKLLAKMTPKDVLVSHLEQALLAYKTTPDDAAFTKVAVCAVLIGLKESADNENVHTLLEQLASDTIPFFMASAN